MGTIRFLLALSVVGLHSAPIFGLKLVNGDSAVQGFFVISGFYMAFILNEKYPDSIDGTKLFYSNRFLRIYPVYWLVLALALLSAVLGLHGDNGALALWRSTAANHSLATNAFLVISNLGLVGLDAGLFMEIRDGALRFTPVFYEHTPMVYQYYFVPQAWTLGIEVIVYVVAPFLFRRSIVWLLAAAISSFALRAWAYAHGYGDDPWSHRFLPFEFGLFAIGALSYRAYAAIGEPNLERVGAIFFAALLCLTISYSWLSTRPSFIPGIATSQGIYLSAVAVSLPFIFAWSRRSAADRWIGNLSYPLYLCHLLVIPLCGGDYGFLNWIPGVGSTALAVFIAMAVDAPINNFRQWRVRNQKMKIA